MDKVFFLRDDPNATKLAAITELLGAESELIDAVPAGTGCLILRGKDFEAMRPALEGSPHAVLVYDIESSQPLTAQFAPERRDIRQFQIGTTSRDVTGPLTGLELDSAARCPVFARGEGYTTIISADGRPFFVMKDRLFVLGARGVADINACAENGSEPARDHFAKLVPFAMFVKWALPDQCWRTAEKCATIIIDDPLLRPRYGCIEFEKFLGWLREDDLAATFAFIPWNHARSNPKTVPLFRENPERLSICVHGCDHTKSEFGETNPARLDAMARTALARMDMHEARYGLPYDRVMVFPQGKFSTEAPASLKRSGYMAAVNTSPFPANYNGELTVRDLLDIAVTQPDAVPVFRRRYPTDVFSFASDLFLERPVFIVQHHQDFRDGFGLLSSFISKVRDTESRLRWIPLGAALRGCQWTRGNGEVRQLLSVAGIGELGVAKLYTIKERANIAARRYLSEFRDRFVHPNRLASALLARMR